LQQAVHESGGLAQRQPEQTIHCQAELNGSVLKFGLRPVLPNGDASLCMFRSNQSVKVSWDLSDALQILQLVVR